MAIQDTFIGNLRAADNIARGMAPVAAPKNKVAATEKPKNVPKTVDQPTTDWGKWRDSHDAAVNGTVWESTAWNNPVENDAPKYPLNFEAVQAIKPYKPLFDQAITEYQNESNVDRRIKMLDDYGSNTALGALPGISWYLQVLRNTDDAAKRSGNVKYDYAGTADGFKRAIEAEINKFNPRT